METRAPYVVIGSVVLIAIALAFYIIIQMSQTSSEYDQYDVIFKERVSGLSVGAAVRFNGIQKGEVETLSIDPENPSIVIARVRVDKDTPVKTDTKAELEFVGFTGLAIIQFVGGSRDAPLLKEVSDMRVPQLSADTSGLGAFLEGSGDVLAQANRAGLICRLSPLSCSAMSTALRWHARRGLAHARPCVPRRDKMSRCWSLGLA